MPTSNADESRNTALREELEAIKDQLKQVRRTVEDLQAGGGASDADPLAEGLKRKIDEILSRLE